MRLAIAGPALLAAIAAAAPVMAQTPPAASAATRTVLAGTKLADFAAAPVYFCAIEVTIPSNAAARVEPGFTQILYQLQGATEVTAAGQTRNLAAGDAVLLDAAHDGFMKAGADGPSRLLVFAIVPEKSAGSPFPTEPASAAELFRSPAAIPDLKPGAYEVNLTRVTFPPGMPSNPPHHRSGAAVYYVLSGTGANTVAGNTAEKGPGSWVYEPSSLVHQWGNPGREPWTFLAFNINPEGVPAVVPEAAPK